MKKIIYPILFAAATLLTATSCSDDDDNGNDNCLVCGDEGMACDNGDGTLTTTFTEDGEEVTFTIDIEDTGFETFADLKAAGCDAADDDDDDM